MGGQISTVGNLSTDCPEKTCDNGCYEPCQHTNEVIDLISSPLLARDELLQDYIHGSLEQQEEFLKAMCEMEPDICQIGEWLGFPCKQCIPGDDCCCKSKVTSIKSNCAEIFIIQEPQSVSQTEFDFNSTTEAANLYSLIVNALKDSRALVNFASVNSVETFIQIIWPDSYVARFENSVFYICLGRAPTDIEISIKNLIARALPLPIGACMHFVECEN